VSTSTLIVGCGYLGTRVASLLVGRGERVLGTVRSLERGDLLRSLGIEPLLADVRQPGTLEALPAVDRVLYCVGSNGETGAALRALGVDGLRNVLDALTGRVGRLVYASSTGVYGAGHGDWIDEEAPTDPLHESGRVILDAEGLLRSYAEDRGPTAIILRFAGLYGPDRIPRRASLLRGEPIVGDPDRPLNLVHIDDAAAAAVAALDRGRPGRIYLVSDDRPLPRREYYTLAARLLGAPTPTFLLPTAGSPQALREAASKRVSNRRLRTELDVKLSFQDIYTGLPHALGR
jgi:nucleoside-diphosphate-sugar epimerase